MGNPNAGKTTIFNAMTGAHQHIGNYPGVTVEKKEGICKFRDKRLCVVDLPGAYSLVANSLEEIVARNFIINDRPDVIISVADATNLERHLFLTTQLIELGIPVILALNMYDITEKNGTKIDIDKLSKHLGIPIVITVGYKSIGIKALLQAVLDAAEAKQEVKPLPIPFPDEVMAAVSHLSSVLTDENIDIGKHKPDWVAMKLLENDSQFTALKKNVRIRNAVKEEAERIETRYELCPEMVIANARRKFIVEFCKESICSNTKQLHPISDKIDAIVLNKYLAFPIFAILLYFVFQLVFVIGQYPMDWIDSLFAWLAERLSALWPEGSSSALRSLILDGIIAGVGGVLVFLPNILLLFLAIAILEGSGYMARVGFIMDKIMQRCGLQGKSFIPMMVGFGCSVPGIMATRTLENSRDRMITIMVLPLMSCGARLPIYTLIIAAFFPLHWQAPMLFLIYFIGIVLAVLLAKLLRVTIFRGESEPFILELPSYRIPTVKSILLQMWERSWLYLRKAGTIILAISIVMWVLVSYPAKSSFDKDYDTLIATLEKKPNTQDAINDLKNERRAEVLSYSVAGRIGHALDPVLSPMGFDWRIGTALIGAFAAKEVFVSQLGVVFSLGDVDNESDSLRIKLRDQYSPLVGFCIMLFCLITMPCVATFAIVRRETFSWKWPILQAAGLTLLAWIITTLVFQIGRLAGLG